MLLAVDTGRPLADVHRVELARGLVVARIGGLFEPFLTVYARLPFVRISRVSVALELVVARVQRARRPPAPHTSTNYLHYCCYTPPRASERSQECPARAHIATEANGQKWAKIVKNGQKW